MIFVCLCKYAIYALNPVVLNFVYWNNYTYYYSAHFLLFNQYLYKICALSYPLTDPALFISFMNIAPLILKSFAVKNILFSYFNFINFSTSSLLHKSFSVPITRRLFISTLLHLLLQLSKASCSVL